MRLLHLSILSFLRSVEHIKVYNRTKLVLQPVCMELDMSILTHEYMDIRRMSVLDFLLGVSTKPNSSTVNQHVVTL